MLLDVANLIASTRKARGLSKKGLGAKVGVSHQAVTKWEGGDIAGLKFENLVQLCTHLGLRADVLVGLAKAENPDSPQIRERSESLRDKYYEEITAEASRYPTGVLSAELLQAISDLSAEGQALVHAQLRIAIVAAKELHGTRSQQTAA